MGQSSPSPSIDLRRKSSGPKRSEMRPQWLVRPPSMRARHQLNSFRPLEPGAFVYGSPSMSHPPMQPSNSPNGFSRDAAPRRGDAYDGTSILESRVLYHSGPASTTATFAPAFVRTYAAIPPPAPEPTITTS